MTLTIEDSVRTMQAEAQEAKIGTPCVVCKLYPFYMDYGTAVCQGHIYSRAGRDEYKMSRMCEFCFDEMEPEEERAWRTGGVIDDKAPHELPLDGQVLQTVTKLDDYDSTSGRFDTGDPELAQVITSRIDSPPFGRHKVVLDLDLPAKLIPSSTEGHFHLYVDHELTWEKYKALLVALGEAGILEEGYVRASLAREFTAVRLPWVHKPAPEVDELTDAILNDVDDVQPIAGPWPF